MTFTRDLYHLSNNYGWIQARVFADPGSEPELEPWMVDKIQRMGWTLTKAETGQRVDVSVHGRVDWAKVAQTLAEVLRPILDDSVELDAEASEQLLGMAEIALADYDVAHMEIDLATPITVEHPTEGDTDAGDPEQPEEPAAPEGDDAEEGG